MKNETVKAGMKIGATIGGLVFLVLGIVPGFYFGSYGTLILLQKLSGGAVDGDCGGDRLRGSGEHRGGRPFGHGHGFRGLSPGNDAREERGRGQSLSLMRNSPCTRARHALHSRFRS